MSCPTNVPPLRVRGEAADAVSTNGRLALGQTMQQVLIRECTHHDLDSIFQLDRLWDEEGVAYVFTYGTREDFMADFERFQKDFLVAESNGQIIGYINGAVRVNEKVVCGIVQMKGGCSSSPAGYLPPA
jgi:hypothetical protein